MGTLCYDRKMTHKDIASFIEEHRGKSIPLSGACAGVYFLFDKDKLVYVGQGWNCFLRVAEHTRKEPSNHTGVLFL
jgi:hypothetical protein